MTTALAQPPIDRDPPEDNFDDDDDSYRFNIILPREAYDGLEQIRRITGKSSIHEVVQSLLPLYKEIVEHQDTQSEEDNS